MLCYEHKRSNGEGTVMRGMAIFATTALLALSTSALADKTTSFADATGTCTRAVVKDLTSDPGLCSNKMVNVVFPNGRVGFIFILSGRTENTGGTFSFFGDGPKQIHRDKDNVIQPVDKVHFASKGTTDDLGASGSCVFENVFKGVPAKVSCSAETTRGKFIAEFLTNGTAPNVTQTP
jgi:hypothetical protein